MDVYFILGNLRMKKIILGLLLIFICPLVSAEILLIRNGNTSVPIPKELSVTTLASSEITNTTAILELNLEKGGSDIAVWFEIDTIEQVTCVNQASPNLGFISTGETYQAPISSLLPDTKYYYRACAQNKFGIIASGERDDFHTTNTISLMTDAAREVSTNSALLNGTLISGSNIDVWFTLAQMSAQEVVCGLEPVGNINMLLVSANEKFTDLKTELESGQHYQFRACGRSASAPSVTVSGEIQTFMTSDENTEIVTLEAISIGASTATIGAQVISGSNVTVSFVVGGRPENIVCAATPTSQAFENKNTGEEVSFTTSNNSTTVNSSRLLSNSVNYYTACATNHGTGQTVSGGVRSFITDSGGGGLNFISLNGRTDSSVTVTGGLVRAALAQNTWFIIREGNVARLTDANCSQFPRRHQQVLGSIGERNAYTMNSLKDDFEYTMAFCGEGLQPDLGGIRVGTTRNFKTKRNSSTVVEHNCGSNEVFSSNDGPLRIRVTGTKPLNSAIRDSAPFRISNFGTDSVVYRIEESAFGAQTVNNLFVSPSTRREDTVVPRVFNNDFPRQDTIRYQVNIFSASNWQAEFDCQIRDCIQNGTAGGRTGDQVRGLCGGVTPIR